MTRRSVPRRFGPPILAALALLARTAAAEPIFPPGSGIGLEPPPGFVPSRTFSGFENQAMRSSLLFLEAPAAAAAEMRAGFTREGLAGQGMIEESRGTLTVGGREALLVRGRQQAAGQTFAKWVLLVPGEALTALVTANIAEHPPSPATVAAVERALASVALRGPQGPAAQRAALPFTFEETPGLRFRLAAAGSSAVLAPPGAAPGTPGPSLVIARSLDARVPKGEAAAVAEAALRGIRHLRGLRVESSGLVPMQGAAGAVLTRATATDARSGQLLRIAQWLAFYEAGGTLRAYAEAPDAAFEAVRPEFEWVVASLKPR